ncbi:MAG: helix-turn-helix transcriptional regulator [Streptosporangiaceae bacterium]
MDQVSPRRPQDPPWRSRTAHRTSDPEAMTALRRARERHGWTMTRVARETGVSHPMISLLERGLRLPSESLAEALITGYGMTGSDAAVVRSIALQWVGRDSPFRTGVSPPDAASDPSWDTQGNRTHGAGEASQGRTDAGTGRATGQGAAGADAEAWIQWAREKAEQAQATGDARA